MWWSDNLFQGLVSEFVEYVGGGVGVSGVGKFIGSKVLRL